MLALLFVSCQPVVPEPGCTLEAAASTEECPVSPCAVGCGTVREGIACCVGTHGRGLTEEALLALEESCTGSDCDSALYLGAEAALCAAQVQGLEPGIARCGARFVVVAGFAAQWHALNTVSGGCVDGEEYGDASGRLLALDARTGLVVAEAADHGTLYCGD